MVLALAFIVTACGSVKVEYKDKCFIISGLPANIQALTIRLSSLDGTTRLNKTVDVQNGKTALICIGEDFRRTYQPGEIEVVAYDPTREVQDQFSNTKPISFETMPDSTMVISYGLFEKHP